MKTSTRFLPLVALMGVLALAGCGSSSKSSSSSNPTTTVSGTTGTTAASSPGTSEVCQSINTFKSSLSDITSVSTLTGGKDGIQSAIDKFKQNLDTLKSSLKSDDKPKVDALNDSVKKLQDAVGNISGVSGIGDATDAAQDVGTSAQALIDALKAGCPAG